MPIRYLKVKKLTENAVVPKYQTSGASGFDLHATEDLCIMPGDVVLVSTGLAFGIPEGFEMQVRPRSGLSLKSKLRVANSPGTVDSDYTGEVKVIMHNTGNIAAFIKSGDRIAQGVVCPVERLDMLEVESLEETKRGSHGFGSTGSN